MTSAGSPKDIGTPSSKRSHPKSPASSAGQQEDHSASGASAFRNVSACNRCRVRKNRCDQKLPACSACEKAGTKCVSYDHITKREVPRSYVYYLETRNDYLESLLQKNGIEFTEAEEFVYFKPDQADSKQRSRSSKTQNPASSTIEKPGHSEGRQTDSSREQEKLDRLVSSASDVAVKGISDSRYLGATSGISFARVVFAAVKSSLPAAAREGRSSNGSSRSNARNSNISHSNLTMHDSFFGLNTKSTIPPAPFPSQDLGLRLVNLYFEHANPQIPILHRLEFMSMFEAIYTTPGKVMMPKEAFFLNIVFAIGAAIIVGKPAELEDHVATDQEDLDQQPPSKRRRIAEEQKPPEEYHASAIVHLESVLNGSGPSSTIGEELEGLQAVLLLASFALLRPIPPGLWYIIGVAVRLAVDLGLHADDNLVSTAAAGDIPGTLRGGSLSAAYTTRTQKTTEQGKKEYISDYRRRLWWCTYSLDRLVSSVVGRPFGISDRFVTTQFPSLLDDKYITPAGILAPPEIANAPSHKYVAYHYFRYRLLQSEILQVLQFRQTELVRQKGVSQENPYMLSDMPCPFLKQFNGSFRRWRNDMDIRLLAWRESAPTPAQIGVDFSPLFLELNYWHAVLMLYRQSLSVPADLAQEVSATETVSSPVMINVEDTEDIDAVFLKVAAAGQKVLKIYRLLHRKYLVNYTYLSTHHLFMAGISFLYAIWHSPLVRSNLTLDDVDFTALAGTSVLEDLVVFCPPARACHDAFSRMTKATIQMCLATTGFGKKTRLASVEKAIDPQLQSLTANPPTMESTSPQSTTSANTLDPNNPNFPFAPTQTVVSPMRSVFDTDLRTLFSEEESGKKFSAQMASAPTRPTAMQGETQYTTPQPFNPDASMAAMALQSPSRSSFPNPTLQYPQYPQYDHQSQQAQTLQQQQGQIQWNDFDFLNSVNMPDTYGSSTNYSGIDSLGLGFAWDGNVPGAGVDDNKTSFDMFDGFFFGGPGSGMGYEGNSDNMDMGGAQ